MAQAETQYPGLSEQLAQNIGAKRSRLGQVANVFRRLPIIPIVILSGLILTGIFANQLAPHNPVVAIPENRTLPPVWYTPVIVSVKPQSTDPYAFPETIGSWDEAQEKYLGRTDLEDPRVIYDTLIAEGFEVKAFFPSSDHLLGGDHLGRDVLSRVIHGARVSLVVVSIALVSGLLIGVTMGLVAGYFGGLLDEAIMRITDVWLGLPFILVAIVVVIALGQTFTILIILLALLSWTPFVRNVRGEVLSLKTRDYVSLAKVAGAPTFRILMWHILPGVINTVIVIATLRVGQLILAESILSFLGAGIPPPTPAWGAMVADGRAFLNDAWWIAFFPGVAIFLIVMSLNFLGDWLRDRFDPRLRQL
jgi:peptide/nickel transport system permease protein